MANETFQRRLRAAVQDAKQQYRDASLIDHAGLRGRVRELLTERLLAHVLPAPFEIGAGKIVDSQNHSSAEADVVVYSKSILPPLLYSGRDGIFPVEATFLSVEVKSRLSATEIEDAVRKARRLAELQYIPGAYTDAHQGVSHVVMPAIQSVFAFESDITDKSEIQRYAEKDPGWLSDPAVRSICVVGRGYWWFSPERGCWYEHPPNDEGDEVVEFLALAANSVIHSLQQRGRPRFGQYVIGERPLNVIAPSQVTSPLSATQDLGGAAG